MKGALAKRAFKDYFDTEAAHFLSDQLASSYPELDRDKFVQISTDNIDALEMSARIAVFSRAIRICLPDSVPLALEIIKKSLPEELKESEGSYSGFLQWPLGDFVATYGLEHWPESMDVLFDLTKRFTSEFAIRPFYERYPIETLRKVQEWMKDPNVHVRRLCSEGFRPRLPWGRKLELFIEDPSPLIPILEYLREDEEAYVRKSVANCLNDISKDHPDLVIELSEKWIQNANKNQTRLIKHGLRSLVKDGNLRTLSILGFQPIENLDQTFNISKEKLFLGESLEMYLTLKSSADYSQSILLDYCVYYVRQKGKISKKVFRWKSFTIHPGQFVELKKMHFMKVSSVRSLYEGEHRIEIQINGSSELSSSFDLSF
jgi:3-methyladenine DNA glycosylase AlkC